MKLTSTARRLPALGKLYLERARLYIMTGRYDKARVDLDRAYKTSRRGQVRAAIQARLELSNMGYLEGRYEFGLRTLGRIQSAALRSRTWLLTFLFWRYKGNLYRVKGDYRTALECYRRLLDPSVCQGSVDDQAVVHNLIGLAYQGMGDYAAAARHVQRAYRLYTKLGNVTGQGNTLGNLGLIYTFSGRSRQALPYFRKSIQRFTQTQVKNLIASPLMNWGTALFNLERYDEALQKWQEALPINKALGDISSVAMLHNNIGELYAVKGEFNKSLEHLRRSLKLKTELKLTGYLPSTHNAFARLYYEMHLRSGRRVHLGLARRHALRSRAISLSLGNARGVKNADEMLAEIEKTRRKK